MSEPVLEPWQSRLLAAGCMARLAPALHASLVPRELAYFRDGIATLWASQGQLPEAQVQWLDVVGRRLADLRDPEDAARQMLFTVSAAATANHELVTEWATDIWLETADDEDWREREERAQRETLAMARQSRAAAATDIRAYSERLGAEWATELSAAGLLDGDPWQGRQQPKPSTFDLPFRRGDVVEVSCPWTPTVTVRRSRYGHDVAVRWPWFVADPQSRYRPNGSVAFPVNESTEPWWPYELRPPAAELTDGDPCEVGAGPTRCYVIRVTRYDPPLDDGSLPRATLGVGLLPGAGESQESAEVTLDGNEPLEVTLLHRAYSMLEHGDELDAADGRRLRFVPPFAFYAADGTRTRPAWPLALVTRGGTPAGPDVSQAVAAATSTGGHLDEVDRWRDWTGTPYPVAIVEELLDDS